MIRFFILLTQLLCFTWLVQTVQQTEPGVYSGTGVNGSMERKVDSDVVLLGGIFPVHRSDSACSNIFHLGVQTLEAMVLAVESINNDSSFLPGVTLQFEIRDTCGDINTALEHSVNYVCTDGQRDEAISANETIPGVSGVVGAAFSSASTTVARLLQQFQLPQISYASTTDTLSDKTAYAYFLRTIPPDSLQALAMADIIEYFNWTFVIAIHSDDIYGKDGIKALTNELKARKNSCIASLQSIELPINADPEDYDQVVEDINQEWVRNATVVVVFGQIQTAVGVLTAVRKKGLNDTEFRSKKFTWIGSDGWDDQAIEDVYDIAHGSLRIVPRSEKTSKFDQYFQSLHPNNYTANPWFHEYWEDFFNCTLKNMPGLEMCDLASQSLFNETGYQQNGFVGFTIDAVYAFAHAIRNLQIDYCNGSSRLCEDIVESRSETTIIRGDLLLRSLYNVSFSGENPNEVIEFDNKGDRKGGYRVENLQMSSNGQYVYQVVGHWDEIPVNQTTNLEISGAIQWSHGDDSTPVSVCSQPCDGGSYPEPVSGQTECCWVCRPCIGNRVISTGQSCIECGQGEAPNELKTECVEIQPAYLHWSHGWSVVVLILTMLGIIATTAVAVLFIVYRNHKIVKASSRELTAILLAGILLSYFLPFFFVTKPSPGICGIRRFCVGFSFALCYSALLVKTNRIHRIFNRSSTSTQLPPLVSPQSQVAFTALLVAVQVVIASVWLAADVPTTVFVYKEVTIELRCGESLYVGLLITLGYNFVLLAVTTYFAFRTRKVPQNFNEAKFISFTMYTLCILWLAFIPVYLATTSVLGTIYESGSLALAIILNATVTLCILFVPKIYHLFFAKKKHSPRSTGLSTITATHSTVVTTVPPQHHSESCNVQALTDAPGDEKKVGTFDNEAENETYENKAS